MSDTPATPLPAVDPITTIGELVSSQPARSRLFEQLGVDYCCGGGATLGEACEAKGLDLATVQSAIAAIDAVAAGGGGVVRPADMGLADLADHIVTTHHAYLERELPRLHEVVAKVARVHGDRDERLARVATTFEELSDEVTTHMMKEEQVLFPAVEAIDAARRDDGDPPAFPFGTIANPIRVMEGEHDVVGRCLADIRELTDGLTAPESACNTWRVMIDGLRELELDLHEHIHKENNVLFPRAIEAERELAGTGA